jgi:hypothetical protein
MLTQSALKPISRRRGPIAVIAVAGIVLATIIGRRRGYGFGPDCAVRCRQGHLFSTIWIPGVSVKSLRLGWWRLQRCPVGQHWTLVRPVKETELSDEDRRLAHAVRDIRLP